MLRWLFLPIVLALLASQAVAASETWAWFVAKSTTGAWRTEVGKKATVRVNGTSIFIEITDEDGWRHRLQGSIRGGDIRAKLSTNETDLVDFPLTGKHTKKYWPEPSADSKGREHIELVGSGIVVGLTREITRSASRAAR